MAWRGLHLTGPARLTRREASLEVARDGEETIRVPLEDIGWVIVDSDRVLLSARLINDLADQGAAVLFTDARHHPASILMPVGGYHRRLQTLESQLAAPVKLKQRLWQRIVSAKIWHQATVLRMAGRPGRDGDAKALLAKAERVRPGDPENVEAQAAQVYWPALFEQFARGDEEDPRQAPLNFGYAVVRAMVARELAGLGFECAIGLHHAGQLNPFNLADDVMEPLRPFVDRAVAEKLGTAKPDGPVFDKAFRQAMVALPGRQVVLSGETMTLLSAIGRIVASLRSALEAGTPATLTLPEPLGGQVADDGAG